MTIDETLCRLQVETAKANCMAWARDIRKTRTLVRNIEKRNKKMQEGIVKEIMKKFGITSKEFLIVEGWDICTKRGTILCDPGFQNPRLAQIDASPTAGRNETGHKLPASGGFGHD
jgi:hypothetical protein